MKVISRPIISDIFFGSFANGLTLHSTVRAVFIIILCFCYSFSSAYPEEKIEFFIEIGKLLHQDKNKKKSSLSSKKSKKRGGKIKFNVPITLFPGDSTEEQVATEDAMEEVETAETEMVGTNFPQPSLPLLAGQTFMQSPTMMSQTPTSQPMYDGSALQFQPIQPTPQGNFSTGGFPDTITQTTVQSVTHPQFGYQQPQSIGDGEQQYRSSNSMGSDYDRSRQQSDQYGRETGGYRQQDEGRSQGQMMNRRQEQMMDGSQQQYGQQQHIQQSQAGGEEYPGSQSRNEIIKRASEETIRYLERIGAIDRSKLDDFALGETKSGACLLCGRVGVVRAIGGEDILGICGSCLEKARAARTSMLVGGGTNEGQGHNMAGSYTGGGMDQSYGHGLTDRRDRDQGSGLLGEMGRALGGSGAGGDGMVGGLIGQLMGKKDNDGQSVSGAPTGNMVADQMVLDANGNLVRLNSLVGSAAPYGYVKDPTTGQLIPATSLNQGLAAGSTAIAASAGGGETTTTTTTITASGNQMVLNATGNLVPLGSLPSGSFGYVRDAAGNLVPATSLQSGIAAGQAAVAAGAVPAATAPGMTTPMPVAAAVMPAQQAAADGSSSPTGVPGALNSAASFFGNAMQTGASALNSGLSLLAGTMNSAKQVGEGAMAAAAPLSGAAQAVTGAAAKKMAMKQAKKDSEAGSQQSASTSADSQKSAQKTATTGSTPSKSKKKKKKGQ